MKASSEKSVILVVDDDVDCRELLADLLSNEGYAVACAENGLQALDYLRGSTPALIILDLMMPKMSGWEFRARQKVDPRLESLPVVVTTASGLVEDIDADAVIHKPIDFGLLMSVVKQNCRSN
jgi:CheY-like chemotaxis protein